MEGREARFLGGAIVLILAGISWGGLPKEVLDRGTGPWPVEVKGHLPVGAGEHPRLLFRASDIQKMRERAKTPEGQAIIRRLRAQLNGSDGETLPSKFVERGGRAPSDSDRSLDYYTFSHAAGFGLLYRITGDAKYAGLGKQCMEKAFEGIMDRDVRYSFRKPSGALRAGPVLGWTAVGYDLCYDGWDETFRRKAAAELQDYSEGSWCSIEELTRGERQHPGSNHWGMQVGGAALALLAIVGDPGVEMGKIGPLLAQSQRAALINMTQGFGSGGFFAEGDGTGSMASHISFLPALQAWRTAAGKDFYTPRPNARWMALKWFFLTALGGDPENLRASFPERGAYPHNIWSRQGLSGGGYFSIGFGLATDEERSAILWFYERAGVKDFDVKCGFGLDAPGPYPHHSVLAYVNWPIGMKPKDPDEVLPHVFLDDRWGFYAWRNRWQDEGDVIISILTKQAKGNFDCKAEDTLTIQAGREKRRWGKIKGGFKGEFLPASDGSTILETGDGSWLAIDFSKASGADAMLLMTGPGAPAEGAVEAGGRRFAFLFLGGRAPAPKAEGERVVAGGQTVRFDGKRIILGR